MSDEPPEKNQRRYDESQKPDKGKRPVRETDASWVGSSSRPTSRDERRPPKLLNSTHSISTIDEEPDEEPPRPLRHKSGFHAPTTDSRVVDTRSPLKRHVWWDRHTTWLLERGVDPYPESGVSLEQATQTRDLPSEHTQYLAGLPAFSLESPSSSSESASRVEQAEAQSSSDLARKLRAGITLQSTGNATSSSSTNVVSGGSTNVLSGSTLYLPTGSTPFRDKPPVPAKPRTALSAAENEQDELSSNRQIERVQEQGEQPEQQTTEQRAADAPNTPGNTDNPAVSDLQGTYKLPKKVAFNADHLPQAMRDGSSVLAIISCLLIRSRRIHACVRRS
jgi:hypothetical protein